MFIDATSYLRLYKLSAHDFTMKLIREVLANTGITATAGIGTNLYLAKIAMDIVAKHIPADRDGVRIAELDEQSLIHRGAGKDHGVCGGGVNIGTNVDSARNKILKKTVVAVYIMFRRSTAMKNLTSSVYSFEKLISGGYLYVDKTEYIWRLIDHVGESYFLSRPRRFGKSLTISTLKAVFEGKKELFKGLAIYDKPYDWKPYPIIHLSFGDYSPINNTMEKLNTYLLEKIQAIAEQHAVKLTETIDASSAFGKLIDTLFKKRPGRHSGR